MMLAADGLTCQQRDEIAANDPLSSSLLFPVFPRLLLHLQFSFLSSWSLHLNILPLPVHFRLYASSE